MLSDPIYLQKEGPDPFFSVLNEKALHFMTATVNHWLPLFTRPQTVAIVLDSWRVLQREAGFRLYGYVDRPEHWRYSSARNYAVQEGMIEMTRAW